MERPMMARGYKMIRVFAVDDHPLVREGVKDLLELDPRIRVVGEAGSAEEAIARASSLPEVVLMDIQLPGIDGIEATRRLLVERPDLKIIILSSFEGEYLHDAIKAGAKGYILKSASQARLVEAVMLAAQGEIPLDSKLTGSLFQRLSELAAPGAVSEPKPFLEGSAQRGIESNGHSSPTRLEAVVGPVTSSTAPQTPVGPAAHGPAPLSKREMELLRELGRGRSNKEIGDVLFITAQTVKNHVTSILRKLDVDDRTQAVLKALRCGWISLEETIPEEATQELPDSASAFRWAGR
jgi:two-component system response regulator DegU